MEREVLKQLVAWKKRPDRKPLILLGARQVGKTHILREFGRSHYKYMAYVNCDNNLLVRDLFAPDYDMKRILLSVGAITGVEAREYHVAVAGSLLGIALHQGESFPVGKVNTLRLLPMNFEEFLLAKGERLLLEILHAGDWTTIQGLRNRYIQLLREYYFVGGMPEAVQRYNDTNDAVHVREIQNEILFAYNNDISKHASADEAVRIGQVWRSIPSQLAK